MTIEERIAEAIYNLEDQHYDRNCFWCGKWHEYSEEIKDCKEEFKQAISSLFGGRKLSKQEAIKMRYSKR